MRHEGERGLGQTQVKLAVAVAQAFNVTSTTRQTLSQKADACPYPHSPHCFSV